MGRKGVSKRKPKKSKATFPNTAADSMNTPSTGNSPVQLLIKKNASTTNGDSLNSSGSNKKHRPIEALDR